MYEIQAHNLKMIYQIEYSTLRKLFSNYVVYLLTIFA